MCSKFYAIRFKYQIRIKSYFYLFLTKIYLRSYYFVKKHLDHGLLLSLSVTQFGKFLLSWGGEFSSG
jgi:hypothetical protein